MADQSLSEFQASIGVADPATLNMDQLISCTRLALIDTTSSLQDSEGGVISVLEVYELLTYIHYILHNAVSKWVGNTAHILAHVFSSASRQQHEVWASQLPFLYSLMDMVPSEACFYGNLNWSLAQIQQQSSLVLSQSFPPMRGGKARPMTAFHFNVPKRPVPQSSGSSLAKRHCLENGTEVPEQLQSQPHHHPHHLLLLCRLIHIPIFSIGGGAFLPTGLCLICLRVTIFSLSLILLVP